MTNIHQVVLQSYIIYVIVCYSIVIVDDSGWVSKGPEKYLYCNLFNLIIHNSENWSSSRRQKNLQ